MRVFCLFLSLAAFAVPAELLSNGDFRSGLDGWKVRRHKEFHHINARLGRAEGVPTVSVAITKPAAPQYFILEQAVDIKEGKYYRLSAELRLAGEGKVGLMVKQDHDPWAPYGCQRTVEPGAAWTRYTISFLAPSIDPSNPPTVRIAVGATKGRVEVRRCSLEAVTDAITVRNKKVGDLTQVELAGASSAKSARPAKAVEAKTLVAEFAASSMKARKVYDKKRLAISGRLTRMTPGSRGSTILELDGGAVKILSARDVDSADDAAFIKSELAAAKRRIDAYGDYARKERFSTSERKARELDAYPRVSITATFAGYRSNAANFKDGVDLSVSRGDDLPTLAPKKKRGR